MSAPLNVSGPLNVTAPLTLSMTVGFDLDLTLVDSRERVISAFIRALADLGVEVVREQIEPHLGLPLEETAAAMHTGVDDGALVRRYRQYYDETDAPRTQPMRGAVEALRCVRASGCRAVVVSAKFTPAVHTALAEAGLAELVDVVYGELFASDKSSALITEGVSIYIGDHPGDMTAARNAGSYAVGVTSGANDQDALLTAGADLVLPDLDAFVAWLPGHVAEAQLAAHPA